jgi:hypothetical protein
MFEIWPFSISAQVLRHRRFEKVDPNTIVWAKMPRHDEFPCNAARDADHARVQT